MSSTSGSETRQLNTGVFVRLTDTQLALLQDAATLRGVSVPQLLRDRSLPPEIARAAS